MNPLKDFEFTCPYCGVSLTLRLDRTGGRKQAFVYDCEVCCRPIHLKFVLQEGEVVEFSAECED